MQLSLRVKQSVVVIASLAVCVAAGMWMQYRYASDSIYKTVQERSWDELECASEQWGTGEIVTLSAARASPASLLPRLRPAGSGLLVADAKWRVVGSVSVKDEDGPRNGDAVSWTPRGETANGKNSTQAARGILDLSGNACIAVCRMLEGGVGFLVLYRSEEAIRGEVETLVGSFFGIGLTCWAWTIAMVSIAVALAVGWMSGTRDHDRTQSMSHVLRQAQSLERAQSAVILGLAKLADSRDRDTGEHLERICAYSSVLATELRRDPKYANTITAAYVRLIEISAALHDIGKVGIEDRILLKEGVLTAAERRRMQAHTLIGGKCLRDIEQRLGSSNFLQMAREIALAHHERWDGRGYPHGLAGEAIPLAARIVAVADVYDALSATRVYKPAHPHDHCVECIRSEAGKHFAPDVVEAFLRVEFKFREIAQRSAETAVCLEAPDGAKQAAGWGTGSEKQECPLGDPVESAR